MEEDSSRGQNISNGLFKTISRATKVGSIYPFYMSFGRSIFLNR